MNINAYGTSPAVSPRSLESNSADAIRNGPAKMTAQKASTEDTLSFTSSIDSAQALTNEAFNTSLRALKIASLQQAVRSGQYTVDPANIATAMLKAVV